jgi:hypothetical protein
MLKNFSFKSQKTLSSILLVAFVVSILFICINVGIMSTVVVSAMVYNTIIQSTPGEVSQAILSTSQPMVVPDTRTTSLMITQTPTVLSPSAIPIENTITPSYTPQFTETVQVLPTQESTVAPTFTITPDFTAEAAPMAGIAQQLADANLISTANGTYFRLPDYDSNWNQTNSYQKTYSGYSMPNFILRADASWEIFENSGNWADSGCGIVFHEDDTESHYLVVVTTGGQAKLYRKIYGGLTYLGASYRYEVDRDYPLVKVMLVVEDNWITLFINDQELYRKQHPYLEDGKIAFTVISGSTIDYGTRCTLSHVELWQIVK